MMWQVEQAITRLGVEGEALEQGLAAGSELDLDEVVANILSG
jgi:hypothetical protein